MHNTAEFSSLWSSPLWNINVAFDVLDYSWLKLSKYFVLVLEFFTKYLYFYLPLFLDEYLDLDLVKFKVLVLKYIAHVFYLYLVVVWYRKLVDIVIRG